VTTNLVSVLIVDDEPDVLWVLSNILNRSGYFVTTALNACEALNYVRQQAFDLAFIDMKLPDMNGEQLAVAIRDIVPNLPLVMISGYYYAEDPQIKKELHQKLYTDFIAKPFGVGEVRSAVQRVLTDKK
jgi:two-component system, OmpR family, response regulator